MSESITTRFIDSFSMEKGLWSHEDFMVVEQAFKLFIGGVYTHTLYCCPDDMEELVVGNLASQGIITHAAQVESISINGQSIEVQIKNHEPAVVREIESKDGLFCYAGDALELMRQHLDSSELHKITGGVHLMSLARGSQILATRQDVGRHNALDKLFGYCLLNQIDIQDKILLSSGRVSHEIIQKVVSMGIKIVVSRAAVTSLGAQVALDNGITVLGFTRGSRFNIYSHPKRILWK